MYVEIEKIEKILYNKDILYKIAGNVMYFHEKIPLFTGCNPFCFPCMTLPLPNSRGGGYNSIISNAYAQLSSWVTGIYSGNNNYF